MTTFVLTEFKIRQFGNLEKGWHYGEGVPASEVAICNTAALNSEAVRSGFLETDAFPGINGEIALTVYFRNHCLEFTSEPDGNVTFCLEKDDEEVCYQEGLTLQEAKEKIHVHAAQWPLVASRSLLWMTC